MPVGTANQLRWSDIWEMALHLDQNPSNRSHEAIGGIRQSFEVLRSVVLLCGAEGFVKVLHLFGDPASQRFGESMAHKMLQLPWKD